MYPSIQLISFISDRFAFHGLLVSATTLKPPLYCAVSTCVVKTALTHRGRDTKLLRLSCAVWHCILWVLWVLGVAFMDRTCSCKSHRCLPDWVLGNLGIRSTPWALCHIPWVIPVQFCGAAGHIVLLGGPCHLDLLLPGGCLSGQHRCVSSSIYLSARTEV